MTTFTCASCGVTHDKGWSDEEAAAEAQANFPGIDVTNPEEAPVVCDDCYQHIMGRAQAEAPQMIGPGWRDAPETVAWFAEHHCYRARAGFMVHVKPGCKC